MTDDTCCCHDEQLTRLHSLIRNRYFYGKQMGVAQFQRDQVYHRHQAWLLNRLIFGSGIVCGLGVAVVDGVLTVHPGVAIDGLGRVVVVAEATTEPVELAPDPYTAKLWICYCERCILPAPTCGDPCHPNATLEFDAIEESFRLEVRPLEKDQKEKTKKKGAKKTVLEASYAVAPATSTENPTHPLGSGPGPGTHGDCDAPHDRCVELATIEVRSDGVEVIAHASARVASQVKLAEQVRTLEKKVRELDAALQGNR